MQERSEQAPAKQGHSRLLKQSWELARDTVWEFSEDNGFLLAAGLAFYTALSFAPLVLLTIWAASAAGTNVQEMIVNEMENLAGPQASEVVRMVIQNAEQRPRAGSLAGWTSIGLLLISGTTIFVQLQAALNIVWDVQSDGGLVLAFIEKRLLGIGMMLFILVLLAASVVATTAIGWIASAQAELAPGSEWLWRPASVLISVALFGVVFAVMFRVLPDAAVRWRVVWPGALLSSLLFTLGKFPVASYVFGNGVASAYGAAGVLMVLLVWVYYSWMIVLLGAELTQVWASRVGEHIETDEWAHPAARKSRLRGLIHRHVRRKKRDERAPEPER